MEQIFNNIAKGDNKTQKLVLDMDGLLYKVINLARLTKQVTIYSLYSFMQQFGCESIQSFMRMNKVYVLFS
jgi:hypothetical protein